jgi:hypothetical protein
MAAVPELRQADLVRVNDRVWLDIRTRCGPAVVCYA